MKKSETELITLGAGCFWCIEVIMEEIQGISKVTSGYSGGQTPSPTYADVCSGQTGHAEVVQIEYDSAIISTMDLMRIFFDIHDPTTLNSQGPDIGTQYRSVIFFHTEKQKSIANKLIDELESNKVWKDPIVTQIAPIKEFYAAEDYHQQYYRRNESQPYCQILIAPKLRKFKKSYNDQIK